LFLAFFASEILSSSPLSLEAESGELIERLGFCWWCFLLFFPVVAGAADSNWLMSNAASPLPAATAVVTPLRPGCSCTLSLMAAFLAAARSGTIMDMAISLSNCCLDLADEEDAEDFFGDDFLCFLFTLTSTLSSESLLSEDDADDAAAAAFLDFDKAMADESDLEDDELLGDAATEDAAVFAFALFNFVSFARSLAENSFMAPLVRTVFTDSTSFSLDAATDDVVSMSSESELNITGAAGRADDFFLLLEKDDDSLLLTLLLLLRELDILLMKSSLLLVLFCEPSEVSPLLRVAGLLAADEAEIFFFFLCCCPFLTFRA
jgi:hypothetical protein